VVAEVAAAAAAAAASAAAAAATAAALRGVDVEPRASTSSATAYAAPPRESLAGVQLAQLEQLAPQLWGGLLGRLVLLQRGLYSSASKRLGSKQQVQDKSKAKARYDIKQYFFRYFFINMYPV